MLCTVLRMEHGDRETLGVLLVDGRLFCYTLELPWRDNRNDISRIPDGHYRVRKYMSPKHAKLMWGIEDVKNRQGVILGEVGNTAKDTLGCILLGNRPGLVRGMRAVMNSVPTCTAFEEVTRFQQELTLEIWSTRL